MGAVAGATARYRSLVPAPALAAGFVTRTFTDDFTTTSTIATSGAATSGFNWYWDATGVTSTSDYSVNTTFVPGVSDGLSTAPGARSGILTISGAHNTFSSQLKTTFRTQTGSNHAGGFNHGYFVFYIQTSLTVQGSGGPSGGWPAWWLWDIRALSPTTGQITAECDVGELFPSGTVGSGVSLINTMHNWVNSNTQATATDDFNNNYPNNVPAAGNPAAGWHKFGVLWQGNGTTGTVSFYVDDVLQSYPVTSVNPSGTAFLLNTAGSPTSIWTAMESAFMSIILGTANGWPLNCDYVDVWQ